MAVSWHDKYPAALLNPHPTRTLSFFLPSSRWLDTLPLARSALPGRKGGHSLGALQTHYGLHLPAGHALHDASTDVCLLAQLLPHLLLEGASDGGGSSASSHRGMASSSSAGGESSSSGDIDRWTQSFCQITVRDVESVPAERTCSVRSLWDVYSAVHHD